MMWIVRYVLRMLGQKLTTMEYRWYLTSSGCESANRCSWKSSRLSSLTGWVASEVDSRRFLPTPAARGLLPLLRKEADEAEVSLSAAEDEEGEAARTAAVESKAASPLATLLAAAAPSTVSSIELGSDFSSMETF